MQDYIDKLKESSESDSCDHIFFFHNYKMANILGLAWLTEICNKRQLASANLFGAMPETVMAHELGHNLGANHDDSKVEQTSIFGYTVCLLIL